MDKFLIYILWALLILDIFVSGCSTSKFFDNEKHLEIYYIPFSMSTEGKLFESEMRDLEIPYVSFFCTSEKNIVDEFIAIAFNPESSPGQEIIDVAPYMVIDVVQEEKLIKKIIIGPSVFYKLDEKIYLMSIELKRWIGNSIPKATFPIGNRENRCGGS